jgi:hypothetical protein
MQKRKAGHCRLSAFVLMDSNAYFVTTSFSVWLPSSETALMK